VAAAWAALQTLGANGYLDLARGALDAADRLRAGIVAIPGLTVIPGDATIVAYQGEHLYAVADRLEARGWSCDRQHRPASLHLTVTANHEPIVDDYLRDLRDAVAEVRANPGLAKTGSAPMYGMAARMPVRFFVKAQVKKVIAGLYGGPS
jgi:glutamate/tyrosine decarboxylase-like PLP-dependent enzyme